MAQISTEKQFTRYQVLIIAFLSFIQFIVILDFMVIAPLGAMLYSLHKHVERKLSVPEAASGNGQWKTQVSFEN